MKVVKYSHLSMLCSMSDLLLDDRFPTPSRRLHDGPLALEEMQAVFTQTIEVILYTHPNIQPVRTGVAFH